MVRDSKTAAAVFFILVLVISSSRGGMPRGGWPRKRKAPQTRGPLLHHHKKNLGDKKRPQPELTAGQRMAAPSFHTELLKSERPATATAQKWVRPRPKLFVPGKKDRPSHTPYPRAESLSPPAQARPSPAPNYSRAQHCPALVLRGRG